jgi:hypothetical protein
MEKTINAKNALKIGAVATGLVTVGGIAGHSFRPELITLPNGASIEKSQYDSMGIIYRNRADKTINFDKTTGEYHKVPEHWEITVLGRKKVLKPIFDKPEHNTDRFNKPKGQNYIYIRPNDDGTREIVFKNDITVRFDTVTLFTTYPLFYAIAKDKSFYYDLVNGRKTSAKDGFKFEIINNQITEVPNKVPSIKNPR